LVLRRFHRARTPAVGDGQSPRRPAQAQRLPL
jgi:hypothetical protein